MTAEQRLSAARSAGPAARRRPLRQRERLAVTGHRRRQPGQHDADHAGERARGEEARASPATTAGRDRGVVGGLVGSRLVGEPSRGEQAQHRDSARGADDRRHDVRRPSRPRGTAPPHIRPPRRGRSQRCRSEGGASPHIAVTAAMTAITTSTSTDSTSLSAMPNVWIAHSLTGPGVRSMTADPTAVRASASVPTNTATSWVTPRATAAAAMPAIAFVPRVDMLAKLPTRLPERLTEKLHRLGCFTIRALFGKGARWRSRERRPSSSAGRPGSERPPPRRWPSGVPAWRCSTGRSRRARKSPTPSAGSVHEVDVTDAFGAGAEQVSRAGHRDSRRTAVTRDHHPPGGGAGERDHQQDGPHSLDCSAPIDLNLSAPSTPRPALVSDKNQRSG